MLHDVLVALRRLPRDRYMAHRAVAAAMGRGDRGLARNYLFAVLEDGEPGLIVVRTREPERLAREIVGTELQSEPVCTPAAGKRYAFWLRASPRVSREGRKHAIPPDRHDRLAGWMAARGEMLGVAFDGPFTVRACRVRLVAKGCKTTEATVTGTLRVTDPARLARALEEGVGPHKTMGFGLLQIHPLEK